MLTDTIAAVGTALSNSGISIIRISGEKSLNIINKVFKTNSEIEPNTIVYGKIINNGNFIDDVLVSYFKAPKSFTGEDICEINCHGGNKITKNILEIVLENGARLATPGEFSKRAFLNGKMDLSQAEATINLINAKTDTELRVATNQKEGIISNEIDKLRNVLIELLAQIEVSVDYPEYDYEEIDNNNLFKILDEEIKQINKIINTYDQGRYIKDGINVSILGKPNVGKSSLLNNLANYEKAIVTDIPGTTRDIVEETINLGDIVLNLSDTAGIRDTDDIIEKIGVDKSLKILDETDLVIYMINANSIIDDEDKNIISKIQNKGLKFITVINKIDQVEKLIFDVFLEELKQIKVDNPIFLSVKDNHNIDNLKNRIKELFLNNDFDYEHELIITSIRHKDILKRSVDNLYKAKNEIEIGQPIDIVSIYVKDAANLLGEIIGSNVSEDVISKIFEKFCLGK